MQANSFIGVLTVAAIVLLLAAMIKLIDRADYKRPVLADKHMKYNGLVPSMEKISRGPKDACWSYYVDHTTNHVYIVYDAGYHFGLASVQNPDGTPMTLEQLANRS